MRIAVIANNKLTAEFSTKIGVNVDATYFSALGEMTITPDVLFYLLAEDKLSADIEQLTSLNSIVIVNAVVQTLQFLPAGLTRINAWPGFLQHRIIEVATAKANKEAISHVFAQLGWAHRFVKDVPGFIAARIIAMIINEAYFAASDGISERHDIDTAMKLGTNYPFGPFEWAGKIGLSTVAGLLQHLAQTDERYVPSPLLLNDKSI